MHIPASLLHYIVFISGFLYYIVLPPVIGSLGFLEDFPALGEWYNDFSQIIPDNHFVYVFVAASLLLGYFLGAVLAVVLPVIRFSKNQSRTPQPLLYPVASLAIIAILILFSINPPAFGAYRDYNVQFFGMLSTLQIVCMFFYFYTKSYKGYLGYAFLFASAAVGLYLFFSGVRLPLINFVLAIVIERILRVHRLGFGLVFTVLCFVLVICTVGALRVSHWLSVDTFAYYLVAEGVFSWWSASTLLANEGLPLVVEPWHWLSSLTNFLPSFLFPMKDQLVIPINSILSFQSPRGAVSIIVSSIGSWGVLGAFLYTMPVGFAAAYSLRLASRSRFARAYHVTVTTTVAFQVFRDGAPILLKQIMYNTLLLPALILVCSLLIREAVAAGKPRVY